MLAPHQLHTLRTVLATGSYAGAAAELRYTPSAVSQQMSALERATGLVLFERSAHSIRPTPHAELLAERAAGVLAMLAALDREVAAIARGEAGVLRIGSFPTASARLLPGALAALRQQRPGVEVEVDEGELGELLPRLLSGELDLALAYRYDAVPASWPAGLVETELLREPLSLLLPAGHRVAGTGPVRLAALAGERWVAPLAESPGALNLDRLAARAGFVPRVSFRSNDYSVVRGLVAAGLGVALVPGLGIGDTDGVLPVPVAGRQPRRAVLALHRAAAPNGLIAAALAAIQATSQAAG